MKGKPRKVNNTPHRSRSRAWTPLVQAMVPEEARKTGVVAVVQNQLYTVFIKETTSPGFEQMGKDGKSEPMQIRHLLVIRNDKKGKEIKWDHKQRIKNELCGPMCEAVELFPAEWRNQKMSQTHIWVLAPGASFPLGIFPEDLGAAGTPADVIVTKEDLEVFVVRGEVEGESFIEVFGDEEEAKAAYDASGNILTGGGIERIGDVPTIDDGAAWTDAAKVKVAKIISKAEALDKMNMPDVGEDVEMPFYDDGPDGIEEELGSVFDMSLLEKHADQVYGPPSTEENIQIAEFMERKLGEMKEQREIRVGDAARIVGDKVAETEVEQAEEVQAAADLDGYREKLRKDRKKDDKPN